MVQKADQRIFRSVIQKKAVLINDLSGFGRCSIAVQLPVLSVLKAECLLMPTSLLSAHTGYPGFWMRDLSEDLNPWIEHWQNLSVIPDAILTGFIADEKQIEPIERFVRDFAGPETLVIADPVFADHGRMYASCTPAIARALGRLCTKADVITPNITEAAFLCGISMQSVWSEQKIVSMGRLLCSKGAKNTVITGISLESGGMADYACSRSGASFWRRYQPLYPSRAGTGDIFAAVLCGKMLQGTSFFEACQAAGTFVEDCLEASQRAQVPPQEGCAFELVLDRLLGPCTQSGQ